MLVIKDKLLATCVNERSGDYGNEVVVSVRHCSYYYNNLDILSKSRGRYNIMLRGKVVVYTVSNR